MNTNDQLMSFAFLDARLEETAVWKLPMLDKSSASLLQSSKVQCWHDLKLQLKAEPAEILKIQAQLMTPRKGVLWGLVCGECVPDFASTAEAAEPVESALRWTIRPDEVNRKLAGVAAEKVAWNSAEGLLARAAAWSSGSILPENIPVFLPAPEGVAAQMIAGAIMTLAAKLDAIKYSLILRQFIKIGEEIAEERLLPQGWHMETLASEMPFGESVVNPMMQELGGFQF